MVENNVIYLPAELNSEREVVLTTYSKSMFPDGSLGHSIFPASLEGRSRSQILLDTNLGDINLPSIEHGRGMARLFNKDIVETLRDKSNITTLSHLLRSDKDDLSYLTTKKKSHIKTRLSTFLKDVVSIGPEGFLITYVVGLKYKRKPISLDAEKKRNEILHSSLLALTLGDNKAELIERNLNIFRDRHGLIDGNPKTLAYIGNKYHLTKEAVRQIERRFYRKLRSRNAFNNFLPFFSFREGSLGATLGINCPDELKQKLPGIDLENTQVNHLVTRQQVKQLKNLNLATSGTPIISFLSNINTVELPPNIRETILNTFYTLEYLSSKKGKNELKERKEKIEKELKGN